MSADLERARRWMHKRLATDEDVHALAAESVAGRREDLGGAAAVVIDLVTEMRSTGGWRSGGDFLAAEGPINALLALRDRLKADASAWIDRGSKDGR